MAGFRGGHGSAATPGEVEAFHRTLQKRPAPDSRCGKPHPQGSPRRPPRPPQSRTPTSQSGARRGRLPGADRPASAHARCFSPPRWCGMLVESVAGGCGAGGVSTVPPPTHPSGELPRTMPLLRGRGRSPLGTGPSGNSLPGVPEAGVPGAHGPCRIWGRPAATGRLLPESAVLECRLLHPPGPCREVSRIPASSGRVRRGDPMPPTAPVPLDSGVSSGGGSFPGPRHPGARTGHPVVAPEAVPPAARGGGDSRHPPFEGFAGFLHLRGEEKPPEQAIQNCQHGWTQLRTEDKWAIRRRVHITRTGPRPRRSATGRTRAGEPHRPGRSCGPALPALFGRFPVSPRPVRLPRAHGLHRPRWPAPVLLRPASRPRGPRKARGALDAERAG
ncbi:hypothetical protein ABH917_004081 [Thermobifida halotolerans]